MSAPAHRLASLCVFCASSDAAEPALIDAAAGFGRILASEGVRLVYGGGAVGLMGACARAVHDGGGEVLGIIPEFLIAHEVAYAEARLEVVPTMHARKMRMIEESDAFAVLPGAIGTMEEAIEVLSWRRLGLHAKPLAFFNPDGFWDHLFAQLDQMTARRLLPAEFRQCWSQTDDIDALLPLLRRASGLPTPIVPIVQRA
jgi:uncharacterized protein (TIGR00730 family)